MRLIDYVSQGGSIMYLLLLLNIFGMSVLLWRVIVILDFKKNFNKAHDEVKNELSSVSLDKNPEVALMMIKDEVGSKVHKLEFGLNSIKIIASIAPLLGLLGTVIGILSAFNVIAEKGLNDPALFAGGISMALVTTVGGLIVAIPHFIGYNYLVSMLDDLEMKLEKSLAKELYKKAI